jgi:hypothetical protein
LLYGNDADMSIVLKLRSLSVFRKVSHRSLKTSSKHCEPIQRFLY